MIDYQGPEIQLVCDSTARRYKRTYDRDEFFTMLADAKEDGWLVTLQAGEWRHFSPEAQSVADEISAVPDVD